MNYYNEIDPYAAAWLRNLIAAGHLAPGDVDERSIEDVLPDELRKYTQCHFFAGIGVWALALDNSGWPRDRPVWTGSCPCQPFSAAGKGGGFSDERHLWPAWQHLIAQCRPAVVFGEQVASKAVDAWIDLVHADVEGMGYAFGGIAFPSAGVGAPHIRDRTFWVADSGSIGRVGRQGLSQGRLDDRTHAGRVESNYGLVGSDEAGPSGLADAEVVRRSGCDIREGGLLSQVGVEDFGSTGERPGPTSGFWRAADWLGCTDGKWRPVEPGTFPLVNGASSRVGRLRAYGNAINAQAAQAFIESYLGAE